MKGIVFFFIMLFHVSGIFAQDSSIDTLQNIVLTKDPRLDVLVEKTRQANEYLYYKTLRNMQGFRLQVITTNDRNSALSVKTRMLSDFPGEKTYFIYHAPYFKIQMGNFRTREAAEQLMQEVKKIYPSGVFIVPSKIEIRPSKEEGFIFEALEQN